MTYRKKSIPEATRRAVALRYGCEPGATKEVSCHWCGAPGLITWGQLATGGPSAWVHFSLSLDHIVPEFHGGTLDPSNFVLACRECNSSRGHRHSEPVVNGSRPPHDSLTEPVCKTMSGKGREGNKEGKGGRVETSHHVVAYVTREAATA